MSSFARGYWTTLRPYLFPVSGAVGLTGLSLGDASPTRTLAASVVFFVAYGLGQALTDLSQTDTDALSSPYRPLVRGDVTPRAVLLATLAGLASCGLLLFAFNPQSLAVVTLSVLGLATYTPMKRRFWAGPPWNSWIVALLPLLGVLIDGRPLVVALAEPAVRLTMASAFFGYATFVLLGYLKDVEADRATGYRTVAVRFGRRACVAVSAACVPLAVLGSARVAFSGHPAGGAAWSVGLLCFGLGAALLVVAHVAAWDNARDEEAHGPIALGVRGLVLLSLGRAVLCRPALLVVAVAMLAWLELSLAGRPEKAQV